MKLIKLLPAAIVTVVLAACSTQTEEQTASQKQAEAEAKMQQAVRNAEEQAKQAAANIQGNATIDLTKVTNGTKSVVYSCLNKQTLSATYSFQDNEAKAVNIILGKGKNAKQIPTLLRDENNVDFVAFKSDTHLWNVESGFNLQNATNKSGGNLQELGTSYDTILAKLCNVNKSATARLK